MRSRSAKKNSFELSIKTISIVAFGVLRNIKLRKNLHVLVVLRKRQLRCPHLQLVLTRATIFMEPVLSIQLNRLGHFEHSVAVYLQLACHHLCSNGLVLVSASCLIVNEVFILVILVDVMQHEVRVESSVTATQLQQTCVIGLIGKWPGLATVYFLDVTRASRFSGEVSALDF